MRLALESNATTRPTKALVKKSFLDSMQWELRNCVFIECFAGSAQMGFEALSMGASGALFFEIDSKSFMLLSKNIETFRLKVDSNIFIKYYNIDFFDSLDILETLCVEVQSLGYVESNSESKMDFNLDSKRQMPINKDIFKSLDSIESTHPKPCTRPSLRRN